MSEEQKDKAVTAPTTTVTVSRNTHGGLVPTDMEGMWRLAGIMSRSGFMPKGIQSPEAVFVAVQMGLEVGLSPMQAVQNIAVINGRPSIWGDAAIGLVMSSGLLDSIDERFEGEWLKDDFKAVCTVKRRGKKPRTNEFSISDAKTAGLWKKDGPWQTYPRRMLQMRARSWALRDEFPDVLKGLRIGEEALDMPDLVMVQGSSGAFEMESPPVYEEPIKPDSDRFWAAMEERGITTDDPTMTAYLAGMAETMQLEIPEVMTRAVDAGESNQKVWDKFLSGYKKWVKLQSKKEDPDPEKTNESTVTESSAPTALAPRPCPTGGPLQGDLPAADYCNNDCKMRNNCPSWD